MSTPPSDASPLTLSSDSRLAETGWVDLTPENGWTGTLKVLRAGPHCYFRATDLNGTAAASGNVVSLPPGFIPGAGNPAHGLGNMTSNAGPGSAPIGAVGGGSNQIVRTSNITNWTGGSASINFPTDDPFPA